jgi:hypothetical protein
MPRGPLPGANTRRTNAPTIPTTALPAAGRREPIPEPPYPLLEHGLAWWRWAWHLPQAAAWDAGALYALARRAQLEDDLRHLDEVEQVDFAELLGMSDERESIRRLEDLVRRLKGLAGGRVSVMREMRELDNRFGLNAKAMVDLRWKIEEPEAKPAPAKAAGEIRRLRAVDPGSAG